MTDPAIIEAAERALQDSGDVDAQFYAAVVIDAVTPLIEDAYARKLDAAEEIARKGNDYTKGWALLEEDGSVAAKARLHDALDAMMESTWEADLEDAYNELVRVGRQIFTIKSLIRAAALEEAAKAADIFVEFARTHAANKSVHQLTARDIAARIRALKEQP